MELAQPPASEVLPIVWGWPTTGYPRWPPNGPEFLKTDAADSLELAQPHTKEAASFAWNWPSPLQMRCCR
jgi:hypothetical protein